MTATSRTDGLHWRRIARAHAVALSFLAALFLFRVGAQLVQAIAPTSALPPFDAWHSGTLPYPALVASQVIILAILAALIVMFARARPFGGARLSTALWIAGSVYAGGATLRLIGGFTFASDNAFMSAHLPAFFHLVLASAVLVVASYTRATRAAKR